MLQPTTTFRWASFRPLCQAVGYSLLRAQVTSWPQYFETHSDDKMLCKYKSTASFPKFGIYFKNTRQPTRQSHFVCRLFWQQPKRNCYLSKSSDWCRLQQLAFSSVEDISGSTEHDNARPSLQWPSHPQFSPVHSDLVTLSSVQFTVT
jgi:hypothetical protein